MAGMTGDEIYRNFQDGRGPGGLSAVADMMSELSANYETRAEQIRSLVSRMESAWEGSAAGAAQRGAGPLATEHVLAGSALSTAQDLTNRQAGSFAEAKSRVVPVPPKPEMLNPLLVFSAPTAVDDHEQKVDEYNKAAQNNVDVMNGYSGASEYNTRNLPTSYGTLRADDAGIAVGTVGTSIDSRNFDGSGADGGPGAAGPGPGGSPLNGPDQSAPGRSSAPDGRPAANSGPGSTDPGSAVPGSRPPGGVPPGTTTPETFIPSPTGQNVPVPDPGSGRLPGTPGSGGLPGGNAVDPGITPLRHGVGGSSGTGSGAPGGTAGPRGGAGGPLGGGGSGGGLRGVGGPGLGAGADTGSAARPAPGTGVTAGRGAAGASGFPMGAPGRGRDEEDQEHRRPEWLQGGDPDDLFDSDVLTAPPTIGAEDD